MYIVCRGVVRWEVHVRAVGCVPFALHVSFIIGVQRRTFYLASENK